MADDARADDSLHLDTDILTLEYLTYNATKAILAAGCQTKIPWVNDADGGQRPLAGHVELELRGVHGTCTRASPFAIAHEVPINARTTG